MPITLIRKKTKAGLPMNCMFETITETIDGKECDFVLVKIVDDNLKPLSYPLCYERTMNEETFHSDIRKASAAANQLITSHSTNPEWNPEKYSKNLEDCLKDEES